MITRRTFVAGLLTSAVTRLHAAAAQQSGKVHRIGFLAWNPRSFYEDRGYLKAFREALHSLGWVEGNNLLIEYRFADGKADRLAPLLAELDSLGLDLIVTVNTTITKAAAKVIKTTPIVFTVVADPVASGLVASLAHPGGNVTGARLIAPEIAGKQLELLKAAAPGIARVAVLWEPTNPGVALIFRTMERDAPKLGLTLQSLKVRSRDDFESVFATMTQDRPDALIAIVAPLTNRHTPQIVEFALKNGLPTMAGWSGFPQAGGLMSYVPSTADNFRRPAPYVDKILKGAKPADLPVGQPIKFELIINLKTAKALGLTIPPSLLLRADKVIE